MIYTIKNSSQVKNNIPVKKLQLYLKKLLIIVVVFVIFLYELQYIMRYLLFNAPPLAPYIISIILTIILYGLLKARFIKYSIGLVIFLYLFFIFFIGTGSLINSSYYLDIILAGFFAIVVSVILISILNVLYGGIRYAIRKLFIAARKK